MLEVELKFRVPATQHLDAALDRVGAAKHRAVEQVDRYFAHPNRNFAETDEALRIRRVGERNFVTYKGPKIDAATKTRREIELPLSEGRTAAESFGELLIVLGFEPVTTVRKLRSTYHLTWHSRPVEIALDDVDDLGTFVEIETAASEAELDAAREAITSLARELGLEESERRGYLDMLLQKRAADCIGN